MESDQQLRVLVTSAGGRVGKEVIAHLAKAKKSGKNIYIRACCRRADRSEFIKTLGADELMEFDFLNEKDYEPALKTMNALFSSSPDPVLSGHKEFCKAIKNYGGIKHAVRLSCFGAEQNTASYRPEKHVSDPKQEVPKMLVGYWVAEESLIQTGVPTTSLRANFFMNHLIKNEVDNIRDKNFFKSPLGSCKNSFVCTNDVGEVAAKCILEGAQTHGNKFYDLTGPDSNSMEEVAEILGKAMGKEIKFVNQDIDDFEKDFGPTRRAFLEYLRNGFYTRVSPDFYNLTGKKPTSYYDYLTTKGLAGETGLEELYQEGVWKKGVDIMKNVKH